MTVRLLALAVALAVIASPACNRSPTKPSCAVTIAAADQSRTIGALASSFIVGVQAPAGCAWSATTTGGFLTITAGASGNGNGTIQASASANDGVARMGTISVSGAIASITQQAAAVPVCTFDVSPATSSVPATGGTVALAVTVTQGTNCSWTAATSDVFVTIASGGSGTGNGTVNLTIAPNTSSARSASILIAGRTIGVSQAGSTPCSYAVTPVLASVGSAGGIVTYGVTAGTGCSWQAAAFSFSTTAFLTVLDPGVFSGNGSFRVQASANPGTSRLQQITVAGLNRTIVQDELPGACPITIGPMSISVSAAAQTTPFTIDLGTGTSALCPVTINWFAAPFTSAVYIPNPTGATTVSLNVAQNVGPLRQEQLRLFWGWAIVGNSVIAGHDAFITVTQAAPVSACPFIATPAAGSVPAAGGTATFTITRQSGACAPTAATNDSFARIASFTSIGPNDWRLIVQLDPNPTANARSATVLAGNVLITVSQPGSLVEDLWSRSRAR